MSKVAIYSVDCPLFIHSFVKTDLMKSFKILSFAAIGTLLTTNLTAYGQSHSAALMGNGTTIAQGTQANPNLDNYFFGLKYDPRTLLSIRESGSTETIPGGKTRDRRQDGNKVIICTKEKRDLNKNFDNITLLRPTQGVVFPGALVRANRKLAEGLPDALALPRSPVTISIDLPGLGKKGVAMVTNPANSSVQTAINDILEDWNENPSSQGYVNAARSTTTIQKAYTSDQVSLELGFNADWASNSLTSKLTVDNTTKKNVSFAFFKQVFYTVSMDSPARPSTVFDTSVSLDQLKQVVDKDNPPAYVRSVDYGRIILVKMETNSSETEVDLEATLNYVTAGGVELNPSIKANYERIANNSQFTVITIGGNADVAAQVLPPGQIKNFKNAIRESATYSRSNPGLPIAYTVAFLKDNSLAKLGFTTDYIATECKEYNNGYVSVKHDGGYVAKWQITWQEPDARGNPVGKSWESGNKTAGYTYQLDLPGDATNVNVRAWAATGLVWDPWGQISFPTLNGPNNKCHRITGTTLNRGSEVRDAC
jgi:thiol-activated cytolysin